MSMLCADLKQHCIGFLVKAITAANCFTLRKLADIYRSDKLRIDVNQFMKDNIKTILSRDEFKSLTEEEFCLSMGIVSILIMNY